MMKNLPIRLKLAVIYVIMSVFTVPMMLFFYSSAKGISDDQNAMYHLALAGTRTAGQMQTAVRQQGTAARDVAAGGSSAALSDAQQAYERAAGELAGILSGDTAGTAQLTTIQSAYQGAYTAALNAAAQGGGADSLDAAASSLIASIDALQTHLDDLAAAANLAGLGRVGFLLPFIPIFIVIYFIVTFIAGRRITAAIAFPLQALGAASKRIAEGDIDVEIAHRSRDEVGLLADAFREMVDGIRTQADVLQAIAERDYTVEIPIRSEHDVVNQAISTMLTNNNQLVSNIRQASAQVTGASRQLAQGAQDLASGTTEQAASVQELSASIADVHSQTQTNATNANSAMEATDKASELMVETVADLESLKDAMRNISEDSAAISKVIKVIDEIASKTSLLSLNASVEAARVGQHGRGFAVVADEVRALATQSTEAAKQTATLIEGSARRVQEGNDLLVRTDESVQAVGEQARISAELITQIAKASQEQAEAISEINVGIDQISTIIQGNSATAEQSAAASQQMNAQAEDLQSLVAQFRLREAANRLGAGNGHY